MVWIETGIRREAARLAKKRRRLMEHECLILDASADVSDGEMAMVDTIAAAVDVAGEAEGVVLVQDALSSLTPLQREVITATVLEGVTEKEAAVRLGISQQAVHKVKERALSRLKKRFVLDEPTGK
ncbi:RNA polymerase subunit sigma-24 [Desulfotomaculum copahuensis]|uniref:RNA polymerase subunit sigma-24 n=1 Tax=Desulfotomaculum copahuensis TaxID=1838280 RepID=A0A1B7LGF1_9FIRM|nr:RNA polymerase subunit sigma-24 [Desulfotomaculum copahuensis]